MITFENDIKLGTGIYFIPDLSFLKYLRLWVNFSMPLIGQQVVDQLQNPIVQRPVGQISQHLVEQIPDFLTKIA